MSDLELIEQAVRQYCRRRGYEPVHVRIQVVGGGDVNLSLVPERYVAVQSAPPPRDPVREPEAEEESTASEPEGEPPEEATEEEAAEWAGARTLALEMPADRATVSPDYRVLNWFGRIYHFSPMQAEILAALWEARDAGVPEVRVDVLLRAAGSDSFKIRDLFKRSDAWGAVIVRGDSPGTYRLAARAEVSE